MKKNREEFLPKGIDVVAQMEESNRGQQREWDNFLAKMQPGDEFWFFSAPITYEGYAIIRHGHEVSRFITCSF